MATKPRIPEEFVRGFTMMTEDKSTPAGKIAIPIELPRLAGIPIASEKSFQIHPVVHECIRLFNAKYQGCEYCMNARAAIAVQSGLDEGMVDQLTRFETSSLPDEIKAALRITKAVAESPQALTDEVWQNARKYFSEQEVVDIVLLSVTTTGSKVAITLGVDPGKEASSRVFYPTDPEYGHSKDLERAIQECAKKGFKVASTGSSANAAA